MTLQRTFLALRLIVAVCLAGLAGTATMLAVTRWREERSLAQAAALRARLTALSAALARERGATMLLAAGAPGPGGASGSVAPYHEATDRAWESVAEAVAAAGASLGPERVGAVWRQVEERHERVRVLRGHLELDLASGRGAAAAQAFRLAVTRDISMLGVLSRLTTNDARVTEGEVGGPAAEALVGSAAEALGRARALGADLLARRAVPSADEASELASLDARAREELEALSDQAASHGDSVAAAAVAKAERLSAGERGEVIRRLCARELPDVSAHLWFEVATAGVDAALAVGALLEQRAQRAHDARQRAAARYIAVVAAIIAAVLAGLAVAALTVARRVLRPLRLLHAAARRIGGGDLATPVAPLGRDEVGELAAEMDAMRRRLSEDGQQLREALGRLTTAQAGLIAAERMVAATQLSAGVSHEVNNPLAAVMVNCRCVLEELEGRPELLAALPGQGADARAALGDALAAAERIKVVVDRLRAFTAPAPSGVAAVDPVAEARLAAALVAPGAKPGVVLRDELRPVQAVLAEAGALRHAFLALLRNAGDAVGERGEVTLSSGESDAEVWVAVEDTGPGIPPEVLPRIFEPFFGTKGVGRGMGLGLSLAHGLVAASGGRIGVRSAAGRGSTFTVAFPRRGT